MEAVKRIGPLKTIHYVNEIGELETPYNNEKQINMFDLSLATKISVKHINMHIIYTVVQVISDVRTHFIHQESLLFRKTPFCRCNFGKKYITTQAWKFLY